MLMTIAVILVILWLLGMITSYTMGGLIHILLVIAIIIVLVRVHSGPTSPLTRRSRESCQRRSARVDRRRDRSRWH